MAKHSLEKVVRYICKLADGPGDVKTDDQELLGRFIRLDDKDAFEALVKRHGPMVRDLGRRLLGQEADADDAFQAVFLVLARRARSIRKQQSLASWLYGVACRIAEKARRDAVRRGRLDERRQMSPAAKDPAKEAAWRELCRVLDTELNALSDTFKAPLVLCYLQSRTRDEAARQLGWSLRTLDRRLERGRHLLRQRLTRRGFDLSGIMCVLGLAQTQASAAIPPTLLAATVHAAGAFTATSATAAASISGAGAALADAVLKGMTFAQVKMGAVWCVAAITITISGTLAFRAWSGPEASATSAGAPARPASQNQQPLAKQELSAVALGVKLEQSLRQALDLVPSIKDNDKKVQLLVAAAKVQVKAGDAQAAAATLRQALQFAEAIEENTPQYVAFLLIAQAEVWRGDVPAALKLVDKLQAERQRPSLLVQIARAQAEGGDPNGALKTAAAIKTWEQSNALTVIAMVQAKAGDLPAAMRTVDLLKGQPLGHGSALEEIAVAQAKAGKPQEAKSTMEEARRLILSVIVPQGRANVMATFAIYQAESGDVQGGLETLADLKLDDNKTYQGSKGYIYWRFAVAQVKAGDSDGAVKFAEGLKNAEERISPLLQIAKTQAERGEPDQARSTLQRVARQIDSLPDADQKEQHFSTHSELLAKLGDIPAALKMALAGKDPTSRTFALLAIAGTQVKRNDRTGALATLKQAVKALPPAEEGPRAAAFHRSLIQRVCEKLASVAAESEANAIIGEQTDPFERAHGWLGVAEGLASRRVVEEKDNSPNSK